MDDKRLSLVIEYSVIHTCDNNIKIIESYFDYNNNYQLNEKNRGQFSYYGLLHSYLLRGISSSKFVLSSV